MADTFSNWPPDWLVARGLGPAHTEGATEIPPIGEPSLPYDYEARVKAAGLAIDEMSFREMQAPAATVARAMDWLAFLTAQPPKEEGKEDG